MDNSPPSRWHATQAREMLCASQNLVSRESFDKGRAALRHNARVSAEGASLPSDFFSEP